MQVYWSEKSSCWKRVRSNGDQSKEVTATSRRLHVATSPRRDVATSRRLHVATSPRRDVAKSRRQLEICTLSFKVGMVQKSGYREVYERRHGIPELNRVTET